VDAQRDKSQIPLRYPAREQVFDQLASWWTKTCVCMACACRRPNSTALSSSLAGRRPARDQIPLCYSPGDQLANRSEISSRAGRRPTREQNSVTEYSLNRSATRFELSRHVEIARICLRQVENHSVMEFSLKQFANQLENQLASYLAS